MSRASRRTTRRNGGRARGFTLVEVLVALLVFGMIAAAGVSVMAYAVDNQGVVRGRMERLAEFQRARGVLRADLAQVAPRRTRGVGGIAARDAFIGSATRDVGDRPLFAFVRRGRANPDGDPRASLQYVEYRYADGRLERATRAALDGAPLQPPQVLLSGIREATVAYRANGAWNDGWPGGADTIPEAVELDLELEGLGRVVQRFLLPGDPA